MMDPRPGIRYSCVCYGQTILVSHQVEEENYTPMVLSILETLTVQENTKLTFPVESYQVHILLDGDFCYVCVTHRTNKHYVPFAFLEAVNEKFTSATSLINRSPTAVENEFDRDFAPVLANIIYDFNIGQGDKLSSLQSQVNDVKQIMLDNVQRVLERGERLDDLISKTEDLEAGGSAFRQRTRELYVRERCKNLRMWLFIAALLGIVLLIAVLLATGVIHT